MGHTVGDGIIVAALAAALWRICTSGTASGSVASKLLPLFLGSKSNKRSSHYGVRRRLTPKPRP